MPGDFVINRLEAHREANWLQRAGSHLAEFVGPEADFLRNDAELARNDGAFLFLFAPDAARVAHAQDVFARHRPAYARRYGHLAIERIVKPDAQASN